MVELNGLIEFPRFVPIDRQVEVVRPVLVPTKDQESLREELALAVLVEKLIGEIRTIKTSNPSLKLSLDADLQLLFFSEAFVSHGKVSEDLNKQLNEYLATYRSKTSPNDRDVFIKSVLDDRFALANTVKRANLEIEKIKAIASSRQDQTVRLTQTLNELRPRIKNLENDVSVVTKSFQSTNPSLAKELSRLVEATVDIRRLIDVDPATIRQTETVFVLGDIHGTEEGFIRLESAFRALEEENSRLRNHYVRWQKEIPNASILVDKEKII
jgi:IS1 family transposase